MVQDKKTDELNKLLENAEPEQIDSYLAENRKYMADGKKAFSYYMKDIIQSKGMFMKDVYSFAGFSESYGEKLINQENHTRDRDHIIRLCVAGHFSWQETSRALKLYGFNDLYAKDPRDVCIMAALNKRIFDFAEIDEILIEHGFKKLSAKE